MSPSSPRKGNPGRDEGRRSLLARVEEPARLVIQWMDAVNRHDLPGILALCSDDCRFESPHPAPEGTVFQGRQAIARYWQDFFTRSLEINFETEDVHGLGFRAVARWKCTWVDVDGNHKHIRGADLFKMKNGLFCEILSYVKGQLE